MTTVKTNFGEGGMNLAPEGAQGSPDLATTLRDVADDLAELRTKFIAVLAKLDADAGVTDIDYESGSTPASLKTIKG